MSRTEASIERAAAKRVFEQLGVRSLKLNVGGSRGYPDRLFFIPGGRPLFVEMKRPGGKVEPLQHFIHEMLRGLGYEVRTCDNVDDVVKLIAEALEVKP